MSTATATSPPGTPPPSEAIQSSLPPRNDQADADASAQRKRPRLDSGVHAHHAMSAESSSTDEVPRTPPAHNAWPSPAGLETPSRMTINVRPPASSVSIPLDAVSVSPQSQDRTRYNQHVPDDGQPFSPPSATAATPQTNSSPEIEVTGPEYMDGSSSAIWVRPLDIGEAQDDLHAILMDNFPYLRRHSTCGDALNSMNAHLLDNSDPLCADIIQQLTTWLQDYLSKTEKHPDQWFDWFSGARDLWDAFPSFVDVVVRKSSIPGRASEIEATHGSIVSERPSHPGPGFLQLYASLTARMLIMDHHTLQEIADDLSVRPDLMSPPYLSTLINCMSISSGTSFFVTLNELGFDFELVLEAMIQEISKTLGSELTFLSEYVLCLLKRAVLEIDALKMSIEFVQALILHWGRLNETSEMPKSNLARKEAALRRFFYHVETQLIVLVRQQSSALRLDHIKSIVRRLVQLIEFSTTQLDFDLANQDLNDYDLEALSAKSSDRAVFMSAVWSMRIFKICITKGHMDARTYGIENMAEMLNEVWNRYCVNRSPESHTLMVAQFIGDFICQHQVVRDLLVIGSHRQHVNWCSRIIAFLLVTQRYSDGDTDTIWSALRTNQDPRVIESLSLMTQGLFSSMRHAQLLYLFGKFHHLPLKAFDARFRGLCNKLVEHLITFNKPKEALEYGRELALLFVRILQDLYNRHCLPAEERSEIRRFAIYEWSQIQKRLNPQFDYMDVLGKCLHEMTSTNATGLGSLTVMKVMLGELSLTDVHNFVLQLESEHSLTRVIIEDMPRLSYARDELDLQLSDICDLLEDRLSLLLRIIIYLPGSVTPVLTDVMWRHLVGSEAIDHIYRAKSWIMLSDAVRNCDRKHSGLIERFARHHFPTLPPKWYTLETLAFADAVANYDYQFSSQKSPTGSGQESSVICYDELHWSIAMKTTDPEIAARTIDSLVQRQLAGCGVVKYGQVKDQQFQNHAEFIDRAVDQVVRAAEDFQSQRDGVELSEDENAVILATQKELGFMKLRFHNSLVVLAKFLRRMRCKPLAPRADLAKSMGAKTFPGEIVGIKVQAHTAGHVFPQVELRIGDLATFQDFYEILMARTGFEKLKIIAGGTTIDRYRYAETCLCDLPILIQGLVLVQKVPRATAPSVSQLKDYLTPLENEIMRHFYRLYNLLEFDTNLGKEVYEFLSDFPPHPDILNNVCNSSKSAADLFPPESLFKGLYSIHALKVSLKTFHQQGTKESEFLKHSIQIISTAVLMVDSSPQALFQPENISFITALVEVLLDFLQELVQAGVPADYLQNPQNLAGQLTTLISNTLKFDLHAASIALVDQCFRALLKASIHWPEIRTCVTSNVTIKSIMKALILNNAYDSVRENTRVVLEGLLAAVDANAVDTNADFYAFLWSCLEAWIAEAAARPSQAQQFFVVAGFVFNNLSDAIRTTLPLHTYQQQWRLLLCEHEHREYIGQFKTDWVVMGLSNLLISCIDFCKGKFDLPFDEYSVHALFWKLLFSERRACEDTLSIHTACSPVLDSDGRTQLYRLLLSTTNKSSGLLQMIRLCQEAITFLDASNAWAWGYARLALSADDYNENRNFEPRMAIRSSTGHVGLRNLSNTCYLNSLFAQLFMNVEFRSFLLAIGNESLQSKKLLHEIKRLFSYMQHTWLHAVDPETVADAIITYEGTAIDVSVQMDVDEFYNLLFDRIESEIKDHGQRHEFRGFYGGQLVQQIKSRDCEHVSERLESFSAIQCDIQGKSNLLESLSAYVEGEMMEGDNKYSCTSCGSYVTAVKRACLKDVPDNLIFHLKRFDYNLATGTRSKINESFEFPFEIDMAPYNIEYLKNTSVQPTPDTFVLVGVLVHTGQAEAGHYYSYVCERTVQGEAWFEFNDSEVTSFDPANLPSACFGGTHEAAYGTDDWLKQWNAYMLFYRRKKVSLDTQRSSAIAVSHIPTEIADSIRDENQRFIQKYCLFDQQHGIFVTTLLEKYLHSRKAIPCSTAHKSEREIVAFAFDYLDQIFSHQKDSRHAVSILDTLRRMLLSCPECMETLVDRLVQHPRTIPSLLVKCPCDTVRQTFRDLIASLLQSFREMSPAFYGLPETSNEGHEKTCLPRLLEALSTVQDSLYESPRGWSEYYGLLSDIAGLGSYEAAKLREMMFLLHCLQILAILNSKTPQRSMGKFVAFHKAFERRQFPLHNLIHLSEYLLRAADSSADISSYEDISHGTRCSKLKPSEEKMLGKKTGKDNNCPLSVLTSVFQYTKDDPALTERFVATLLDCCTSQCREIDIVVTIADGFAIEPASEAEPWLNGAISFAENSDNAQLIGQLIHAAGKEAPTLVNSGGAMFLGFFVRIRRAHNVNILKQQPLFFKMLILDIVSKYGARLLYYGKADVRERALEFYKKILVDPLQAEDEVYERAIEEAAFSLSEKVIHVPLNRQNKTAINMQRLNEAKSFLNFILAEFGAEEGMLMESSGNTYEQHRIEAGLRALESMSHSSPEEDLLSTATYESDSGMSDSSTQAVAE